MNIRKIIYEEIDDFDWIRDINPSIPFEDIRFGETLYITNVTDYFLSSLRVCGEEVHERELYVGLRVSVSDIDTSDVGRFSRADTDCGAGDYYGYDGKEIVKTIKINNDYLDFYFWVTPEMVELSYQPIATITEQDDFDWIRDINIDVATFFVPGELYDMGQLYDNSRTEILKFSSYVPNGTSDTFEDGRGQLYFNNGGHTFTPWFIEERLTDKGLSLEDLIVHPE